MTLRKVLAIVLILAGIAVCVVGIVNQYNHCAQMWRTNDSVKADEFASVSEYFWARSKGAVLISVLFGALLAVPGVVMLVSAIRGNAVDMRKTVGITLAAVAAIACFALLLRAVSVLFVLFI